jgi:multidrug efflux pump subunit AcrA (membrane-fusion protein)
MPKPTLTARHLWLLGAVLVLGAVLAFAFLRPKTKVAQVTRVQRSDLTQQIIATGRINALLSSNPSPNPSGSA